MLKLIPSGGASVQPPTSTPPIVTVPVIISEPPIFSDTDYQVSVIASSPAQAPVVWSIPLSWKLSGLARPDIRMSSGVKDWCNYSTLFSNWIYSALTVFLAASIEELTIPVPDQFIDDLDVTTLTFAREGSTIKIYA